MSLLPLVDTPSESLICHCLSEFSVSPEDTIQDFLLSTSGDNVNPGQEVTTIGFQNISSTFKDNLIIMQNFLKGESKKFVWYDGTSFHWVRLDKPMTFTEIADGRFSTQLILRQQIQ